MYSDESQYIYDLTKFGLSHHMLPWDKLTFCQICAPKGFLVEDECAVVFQQSYQYIRDLFSVFFSYLFIHQLCLVLFTSACFSTLFILACDQAERELWRPFAENVGYWRRGWDRSWLGRGRGDVNAATAAAAETVKVVHEHYSRVGQREAASHTVAQLGMMGFQSYWWRQKMAFMQFS